jgi:ferrous iron transport protein B
VTSSGSSHRIAVVGNPNSGKTTIFNALTGLRLKVANYAGVTVERHEGLLKGSRSTLIDLPGSYSLAARSPDEQIARNALLGRIDGELPPDAVLVVIDANNLERNLYLATQIIEMKLPTVIACNMIDVAEDNGRHIDCKKLSQRLGVPVLPTVGTSGRGVDELRLSLESLPETQRTSDRPFDDARLRPAPAFDADDIEDRYARIAALVADVVRQSHKSHGGEWRTDKIDSILLHPVGGPVAFAIVMMLVFLSIFSWSQPLMDLIASGQNILSRWVAGTMREGPLCSLITDGVIGGVGTVVSFFPQICILFFCLGVLEDSGYMARAAFIMDRLMSRVGLHGKSFIPLMSSYACAIPGILATRTIEDRRDRLTTILVAPLMSCSARLPVYLIVTAAVFGDRVWLKAGVMFSLYLLGTLTAMLMALLFKRTIFAGPRPPFIMELPPYHLPRLFTLLRNVWDRSKLFLTSAGTTIFAACVIIWALSYYPRLDAPAGQAALVDGGATESRELASDRLRHSYVGRLGHAIEPVIRPLGFDWRLGIGILSSFLAREVFVGSMGITFAVGDADETSDALRHELAAATWPGGDRVLTPLAGISLMVFYVLACQCVSTLAVVRKETGSWKWPAFMFAYMTALAYVASLVVYQVGRAGQWGLS